MEPAALARGAPPNSLKSLYKPCAADPAGPRWRPGKQIWRKHVPSPVKDQSRGVKGLYKYILFGFSWMGVSSPSDSPKQNRTGFSQAAKPTKWGRECRMLGPGPQHGCPSPAGAHSVPGRVPSALLTPLPPLLSLPAPSPAAWAPPAPSPLPPPIIKGHINNQSKEDSAVTPVQPPFHIHLPSPPQKTNTPLSWQVAKSALTGGPVAETITSADTDLSGHSRKTCQDFAKVFIANLILFVNTFKSKPAGVTTALLYTFLPHQLWL